MNIKSNINKLIQIITLAAAATISSCSAAYAAGVQPSVVPMSADTATIHQACTNLAETAKQVMIARQNGSPIQGLMQIAIKNNSNITMTIIKEAYQLPRYSTKEYQQKSISDFSNQWYLECYNVGMSSNKV